MSQSDKSKKDQQSAAELIADLFVYSPIGALYEFKDQIPELAKKGRSQAALSKMVTQLAAEKIKTDTTKTVDELLEQTATLLHKLADEITPNNTKVGLVIKDYDSLNYSDVVKQLKNLSPEDLKDVAKYEKANKNRKKILDEIQRLLKS